MSMEMRTLFPTIVNCFYGEITSEGCVGVYISVRMVRASIALRHRSDPLLDGCCNAELRNAQRKMNIQEPLFFQREALGTFELVL